MLRAVILTWFILDIVAVMIVLYDYRRWYGQTPNARLVGELSTVGTVRGVIESRHAKSSVGAVPEAAPSAPPIHWRGCEPSRD